MVLIDDTKAFSRLIATWNRRGEELRERLAADPTHHAAWLWAIRLRICTYLVRRYGGGHESDSSTPETADRPVASLRSPSTLHATERALSIEECEHREQFRHRCHETLVRLQPLVADARSRSLLVADSEVKLAHERYCRARRRRSRPWYAFATRRRYE